MVYLYIKSTKNPIVVQLENPIEAKFIRLESLTMYNNWYNLKTEGAIVFKNGSGKIVSINAGHYTKQTLKEAFEVSIKYW